MFITKSEAEQTVNDSFVKVAIIKKNGEVDTDVMNFPSRLLKTDLGYYKKPSLTDSNLTKASKEDDFIVYGPGFHPVDIKNGQPTKKFIRRLDHSRLMRVHWNNDESHFILRTRNGQTITTADLKKDKIYLNEDFKVVPTENKPLRIMLEMT